MTTGGAVPMTTSRAVGPGLSLATVATLALDFGLARLRALLGQPLATGTWRGD